jgi:ATP-dependent Zn protease
MNLIISMPKIYNYSELKNKNMTPNTKTSTLFSDIKGVLVFIAIIMFIGFLLSISPSEDKSKLTPIGSVNAEAQSETLSPEKEIEKLKLELEIKQKQAELSKIDPKAQALK